MDIDEAIATHMKTAGGLGAKVRAARDELQAVEAEVTKLTAARIADLANGGPGDETALNARRKRAEDLRAIIPYLRGQVREALAPAWQAIGAKAEALSAKYEAAYREAQQAALAAASAAKAADQAILPGATFPNRTGWLTAQDDARASARDAKAADVELKRADGYIRASSDWLTESGSRKNFERWAAVQTAQLCGDVLPDDGYSPAWLNRKL